MSILLPPFSLRGYFIAHKEKNPGSFDDVQSKELLKELKEKFVKGTLKGFLEVHQERVDAFNSNTFFGSIGNVVYSYFVLEVYKENKELFEDME